MRAFGLLLLFFASPALAQTAGPVPTSMPEEGAPPKADTFDPDAAKKVLAGVEYKDCGKGGSGKLLITFATDGTVERVVLSEGSWQPPVAICVTRRFSEIGIQPFIGSPHTVKWSVVLEGGPPPAATYSTPPAAPTYAPSYYGGPEVIDGKDGPPPSGYHVEDRRRSGMLVSGAIVSGFGIIFTGLGMDSESASRDGQQTMLVAGIVHLAIGIPLFCVGLSTKRVFVSNNVSFAPSTLSLHF